MIRVSLAMLGARSAWSSLDRTATSGWPFKISFGCHVLNSEEIFAQGRRRLELWRRPQHPAGLDHLFLGCQVMLQSYQTPKAPVMYRGGGGWSCLERTTTSGRAGSLWAVLLWAQISMLW